MVQLKKKSVVEHCQNDNTKNLMLSKWIFSNLTIKVVTITHALCFCRFQGNRGSATGSIPSPIQPSLPSWLEQEMKANATKENATKGKTGSSSDQAVAKPLWWARVKPTSSASVQGQLSIKRQTHKLMVSWTPHWCTVRNCTLSCYRHMGDPSPVMELQLNNQIVTYTSEHKRPYAYRIVINEHQAIVFAADTKLDMDRWMMVLIGQAQDKDAPPPVALRPSPYYILPDMVAGVPQPIIKSDDGAESESSYYLDLQDDDQDNAQGEVYYPPEALLPKVVTKVQPTPQPPPTTANRPVPEPPTTVAAVPKVPQVNSKPAASTAPVVPEPGYQGYLQKRSGPGMWHRRYCIIEGRTLACYAQKGSTVPVQVQPLASCTVAPSHKDGKRFTFKVSARADLCLNLCLICADLCLICA